MHKQTFIKSNGILYISDDDFWQCFMEPLKKVQVEGFLMFAEPQDLLGNLDELCYVRLYLLPLCFYSWFFFFTIQ